MDLPAAPKTQVSGGNNATDVPKIDRVIITEAAKPGLPPRASKASMTDTSSDFAFKQQADRLIITDAGKPVADYVFKDSKILRPYFANVHTPNGIQATRRHPPVEGQDATDHATMHPGIWLAFGDINGHDFWRNKAMIQHERFVEPPAVTKGKLTFTTRNRLLTAEGKEICAQTSKVTLLSKPSSYLLIWDATFESSDGEITFGDQEEMGFGVRVATSITENNGGKIINSAGQKTANASWGKTAEWCDYSGIANGHIIGATIMPDPANFRSSWFHNRDYGVFVANPFGQKAFKQGDPSRVIVKPNVPFRLRFGVLLHSSPLAAQMDFTAAYDEFVNSL